MADTYVHFEIPADDTEKLKKFYGSVFGWKYESAPMPGLPGGEYIMVNTTEQGKPGMNGGMYKRMGADDKPRHYIGVASMDATLRKIKTGGGTIIQPKMAIPNIGWFAFIQDPEKNFQALFQDDKAAK